MIAKKFVWTPLWTTCETDGADVVVFFVNNQKGAFIDVNSNLVPALFWQKFNVSVKEEPLNINIILYNIFNNTI